MSYNSRRILRVLKLQPDTVVRFLIAASSFSSKKLIILAAASFCASATASADSARSAVSGEGVGEVKAKGVIARTRVENVENLILTDELTRVKKDKERGKNVAPSTGKDPTIK